MPLSLGKLWLLGIGLLAVAVSAQEGEQPLTAHAVVEAASEQVMIVVGEAQDYAADDPDRYYQEVHSILDEVIDFRGFARSVMGGYASSGRYRSLDEQGRVQLRSQLDRFTEVMRTGLVRTYSKGLLAFGGSRIEVSKPMPEELEQSKVSVQQLIYSSEADPYVLIYQMGRNRSGEWKLRNVVIESVNLGEIYRNQFEAAARKQGGNLDAVIDEWSATGVQT